MPAGGDLPSLHPDRARGRAYGTWVGVANGAVAVGYVLAAIGLVLCNDVTDRATLLRHVDPWHVESGDAIHDTIRFISAGKR